jgi:hypothetical protein
VGILSKFCKYKLLSFLFLFFPYDARLMGHPVDQLNDNGLAADRRTILKWSLKNQGVRVRMN